MDKQHAGATKTERWNIQGNQRYNTGHSKFKKSVLDTNDVGLVSKYRSKIEEFRQLPPELKISLPNFFASEDQQIGDSETIWILNPFVYRTKGARLYHAVPRGRILTFKQATA